MPSKLCCAPNFLPRLSLPPELETDTQQDAELVDYVFGDLAEGRAREIDQQLGRDKELAAKLEAIRMLLGLSGMVVQCDERCVEKSTGSTAE